MNTIDKNTLEKLIIDTLKTCYDPEIPVNIYDLGLIYGVEISDNKDVTINMTLTSPNCPSIEELPDDVKTKIEYLEGINSVKVNLVWDPPFSPDLMSDEAKLSLGIL